MTRSVRERATGAHVLALALALALTRCAGAIVVPEEQRALGPEEIRAALLSDDFRAKNNARQQLSRLPASDRAALLSDVLSAGDAATRTLAVVELAKLGTPAAFDVMRRAAEADPDADVREMAAMLLEADDEPAPPPNFVDEPALDPEEPRAPDP